MFSMTKIIKQNSKYFFEKKKCFPFKQNFKNSNKNKNSKSKKIIKKIKQFFLFNSKTFEHPF